MGRVSVMAAIATYLEDLQIENLSTIFPYPPKLTPEGDFFPWTDPGHTEGCIVFLFLAAQKDTRISMGGIPSDQDGNGRKAVEYELVMNCYFRSTMQRTEDVAQASDVFLDALVAAIRADRTADSGGVIFQWGEGTFPGSADIEVNSEFPRLLGDTDKTSQVFSHVRVSLVEIIES